MADVHNPDEEGNPVLAYSPRHILKEVLTKHPSKDLTTQLLFSFVLQKFGKNEKEQHQSQNRGMLTLE